MDYGTPTLVSVSDRGRFDEDILELTNGIAQVGQSLDVVCLGRPAAPEVDDDVLGNRLQSV